MAEEPIKSGFNEAMFRMKRIDELKTEINLLWISPFLIHEKYGVMNYEVLSVMLLNLVPLVWAKSTPDEKEIIKKYRDTMLDYLEINPIFKQKDSNSIDGNKKLTIKDNDAWKKLRGLMFDFQLYLEEVYEIHELSSSNMEGDEGGFD